jgi:hypothetical protein
MHTHILINGYHVSITMHSLDNLYCLVFRSYTSWFVPREGTSPLFFFYFELVNIFSRCKGKIKVNTILELYLLNVVKLINVF